MQDELEFNVIMMVQFLISQDLSVDVLIKEKKAEVKKKAEADQVIKKRAAIDVDLVEENQEDIARAKKMKFGPSASHNSRLKRLQIKTDSILPSSSRAGGGGAFMSSRQKALLLGVAGRKVGGASSSAKSSGASAEDLRSALGIKHKAH